LRLIFKMGGTIREFISSAQSMWHAIDALHDAYLASKNHEGQLPVIGIDSVREEQGRDAPVFIPTFKIIEIVPRPSDLPVTGIPLVWRAKRYDKNGNVQPSAPDLFTRPKVEDDMNDKLPF
jgi:hypothetical protein